MANRDEFHDRPTRAAQFDGDLISGKDLQGGGTWLGLSRRGRMAAVTNFRNPHDDRVYERSRGLLVSEFLSLTCSAKSYARQLSAQKELYAPFNLLLYDGETLLCYSSTRDNFEKIETGIHALSNHHIDSRWPKVDKVKNSLKKHLISQTKYDPERLLAIMEDSERAADPVLPKTGVSLEWERVLSPIFIDGSTYGTRSTAVLLIDYKNRARFIEKSHYPNRESVISCDETFLFE